MSDEYIVTSTDERDRRTLFAGLEEDARMFVEQHFPRVHIEPGINQEPRADVHVLTPSGEKHTYMGGKWDTEADSEKPEPAPDVSPLAEDEGTPEDTIGDHAPEPVEPQEEVS